MSLSEYYYRLIKSSWGIAIDVKAEVLSMKNYNDNGCCKEIVSGLWVFCNHVIPIDLEKYIWDGLDIVGTQILQKTQYANDTLIVIYSISYGLCDFQEEGLTAAIIGWAADNFGFIAPVIDTKFNKQLNKYEFSYIE